MRNLPRRNFVNVMGSTTNNNNYDSAYRDMKRRGCCPVHTSVVMVWKDEDLKDVLICPKCGITRKVIEQQQSSDDNNPSFENKEESVVWIEPITLRRSQESRQRRHLLRRRYGHTYEDIKRLEKEGYTLQDVRQIVDDRGTIDSNSLRRRGDNV
jgi:hypothetical protein